MDIKQVRTGFYKLRRPIEVALTPLGYTERTYRRLCLVGDLERARHVPRAMALMHGEYVALAKRALDRMPGDRCGDAKSILAAIEQDPLVSVVAGQNPDDLLRAIEQRLRQNEMPVPECIVCLTMWGTLFIPYHWRFADLFGLNPHSNGGYNLPVRMAGKPKASLAEVMPEFSEDYAPAQPFGLFRILFDCRLLGISWREDAIERSRLFLLKDGERILLGVIPRGSAFNPFALRGDADGTYGLFDVSACGDEGGMPMFRSVSRTCVDAALGDGAVMLFAVAARRRDDGELLAALFSDENARRGVLRLISDTQFFLRPDAVHGTLEFSANLLVSVNHHLRTLHAPQYTVDEAVFHQARPACRIVSVDASVADDRDALDEIARQLMVHNVAISLPEGTDVETVEAIRRRLGYIVLPGTPYLEPGGALCGFQFPDRVLVKGAVDQFSSGEVRYETRERQAANQAQHVAAVARREEKARRRREAHKRLMAEQKRQAEERRAAKQRQREEAERQREEEARRKTEAAFAALKVGSTHFAYHYTRKGTGERQDGDLFADSLDEAYAKLRTAGIRPIKVYPFGERRPAAPAPDSVAGRLERLKALFDMGIVSDAEYAEQRKRILAEL